MSERLYAFLLKLYPDHFRQDFGDEALRLVRDRARSENGFLASLRLWLDLLLDLAISLPREYSRPPKTPLPTTQPLSIEGSFQLLAEPSLNPAVLGFAGMLSAVSFWVCVFVVAHSGGFPALFPAPFSPPELAPGPPAQAPYSEKSSVRNSAPHLPGNESSYSVCMTAQRDIPSSSEQPLLAIQFARPGASGVARIDGKVVKIFKNQQQLSIRAHVFPGDHQFVLHLDQPIEHTVMSVNRDFGYCRPK